MADTILGLVLPGWAAQFRTARSGYPALGIGAGPDSAADAVWAEWFGLTEIPKGYAEIGLALDIEAVSGGPPRGSATFGLSAGIAAVGDTLPVGHADVGMAIEAVAITESSRAGYAEIGLALDAVAAGKAPVGDSLRLGIGIVAVGRSMPLGVCVDFYGDLPITILGSKVSGWHRPLWGEAANLSVTAQASHVDTEWLQVPPLGISCRVYYDGKLLMSGVLAGVRVGDEIELRIEG